MGRLTSLLEMNMSDTTIDATIQENVMCITLNRTEKMNALSPGMIEYLHELFLKANADATVRALLLVANGKAFCAGRDLSAAEANEDAEQILSQAVNPMLAALYHCHKPTICGVNGAAMGIGLGLALACDVIYAGEAARFSSPFSKLGGALDSGGHYFLPRLIGYGRSMELIYTADVLNGREAAEWGLVNRVVSDDTLRASCDQLARRIADGPQQSFQYQKALIRQSPSLMYDAVLDKEAQLQGSLAATAEYREGLSAFMQKRKPNFRTGL